MEIGRWLFCVVVNCVFVCIAAKSVSLNDLIEAESQHNGIVQTTSTKSEENAPTAERFSLGLKPLSQKLTRGKKLGTIIPLGKKVSPLKYRKTFQIKSPLKPKRVKYSLRTRQKRKNQSVKREVSENVKLKQKYIPLLRSLGMLFDNILGGDSSESFEVPPSKRERLRYYIEGDDGVPCKCAESESEEEATASTEVVSVEVPATPEVTPQTTPNPTTSNISGFRQDKNIPVLLPRNTFGTRRNDNGLGERSHSAHHGSSERDITRDSRNSEHDPIEWGAESSASSDEEYTNSDPRNLTSGIRSRDRGIRDRQSGNIAETVHEKDAIPKDEAESTVDGARGLIHELKGEDKLEVNGNEAKSAELLPKPFRRLRGFLSEGEIDDIAESVQSKEDNEESHLSVAHDSSGDQRIPDRSSSPTSKDQEVSSEHEEFVEHKLTRSVDNSTKPSRNKVPVVVIVDGYSVTRHKNGENKLSEKAIHIHSK